MRLGAEVRPHHPSRHDSHRHAARAGAARRQVRSAQLNSGHFFEIPLMNNRTFDVTAIGNAIVDVLAKADDALLAKHNLPKGAMNLIDAPTAEDRKSDE